MAAPSVLRTTGRSTRHLLAAVTQRQRETDRTRSLVARDPAVVGVRTGEVDVAELLEVQFRLPVEHVEHVDREVAVLEADKVAELERRAKIDALVPVRLHRRTTRDEVRRRPVVVRE